MKLLIAVAIAACLMNSGQSAQALNRDVQETTAPVFETESEKSDLEYLQEGRLGDEPLGAGQ
ncbi:MAG: hypothetical protein KH230_15320 [Enterocloster asparagiformis]|nr:hypothetical protein [Enterocloster asparagiformis]